MSLYPLAYSLGHKVTAGRITHKDTQGVAQGQSTHSRSCKRLQLTPAPHSRPKKEKKEKPLSKVGLYDKVGRVLAADDNNLAASFDVIISYCIHCQPHSYKGSIFHKQIKEGVQIVRKEAVQLCDGSWDIHAHPRGAGYIDRIEGYRET